MPSKGDRRGAAAREITRLCGYLPLAIGMLVSQLRHHPARTAADLTAELGKARDRLAAMRTENLSVAAAFDPALDGTSLNGARRLLDELYDQHLIGEPAPGRYRLHDLLREHARTLAAADDPSPVRGAGAPAYGRVARRAERRVGSRADRTAVPGCRFRADMPAYKTEIYATY